MAEHDDSDVDDYMKMVFEDPPKPEENEFERRRRQMREVRVLGRLV